LVEESSPVISIVFAYIEIFDLSGRVRITLPGDEKIAAVKPVFTPREN
jgi:hypothetical protein